MDTQETQGIRKRFQTKSDGFLRTRQGYNVHFDVCDISYSGLKLKLEEALETGQTYALILSIGIKDRSEIIGKCVWMNEDSGFAGFEIRTSDQVWKEIIDYYETGKFNKAA